MSEAKKLLEELKEHLSYNPETGVFRWIKKPSRKINAGSIAGCKIKFGYIDIQFKAKIYRAHRIAWLFTYGDWPKQYIDHINGVTDDNRICNLRDVSARENQGNQKLHRQGKLVGANFHKATKKWNAEAHINKKYIYLGSFNTEQEAHDAYKMFKLGREAIASADKILKGELE